MPFRPSPFLQRFDPIRRLRINRPWVGYVGAFVSVALAVGLRFILPGMSAPFITFYPAIIATALVGGWRPGALAVVLSTLAADYYFIPPFGTLGVAPLDLITLATFVAVTSFLVLLVCVLNEAIDQLTEQTKKVSFVIESEPAGVIGVDSHGKIALVNRQAERMFGYSRQELYGEPIEILVPDEVRALHMERRARFLAKPEERAMGAGRDLHGRRKDGGQLPVEVGLNPIETGNFKGALATVIDISERKSAERRQQILVNEVRHRARNVLTLVQAVAFQTIPLEHRREFMAALASISRTHDLFAQGGSITLAKIIDSELMPFNNRISREGCDIVLTQRAAQDFALIVHELTTNSVKYGALSALEGRVAIVGHDDGANFKFTWEEAGGPAVAQPARVGFGQTILIGVAQSFCSRVEAAYPETGFHYELEAPLSAIATNVVDLNEARTRTT